MWLISNALGLQISRDRSKLEGQCCYLALVCPNGWGIGTEAFHCPPVPISSIPEDTPGPSASVPDREEGEEEDEEEESQPGSRRKRQREDEVLNLISEHIQLQREPSKEKETAENAWTDRSLSSSGWLTIPFLFVINCCIIQLTCEFYFELIFCFWSFMAKCFDIELQSEFFTFNQLSRLYDSRSTVYMYTINVMYQYVDYPWLLAG